MSATMCFVIPVRHPDNMRDPDAQYAFLAQTVASIAAQTSSDWKLVVVGNPAMKVPCLPPQGVFCPVDLPPNKQHDMGDASFDDFITKFRRNKGERLDAARAHFETCDYTMFVDDDDFLHRDLVRFVKESGEENGFYFPQGYIWHTGSALLFPTQRFNFKCGTSHVIRTKHLLGLRDSYESEAAYIEEIFGAHIFVEERMEQRGTPLAPLPMRGAVYRKDNVNAHTGSRGMVRGPLGWTGLGASIFQSLQGGGFTLSQPFKVLQHLAGIRRRSALAESFGMPR